MLIKKECGICTYKSLLDRQIFFASLSCFYSPTRQYDFSRFISVTIEENFVGFKIVIISGKTFSWGLNFANHTLQHRKHEIFSPRKIFL